MTSVEISDLRGNDATTGAEAPIREIHGLFETGDPVTVKTVAPTGPVRVGDTVTFTVTVTNPRTTTNAGLLIADLALTDLLPPGLTPTAANGTVSRGSYDPASGLWQIGEMRPNETATLTLSGVVDAGREGQTITNTTTRATGTRHALATTGDVLTAQVQVLGVGANSESGTAVSGTASTAIANVRANDFVGGVAATDANSTIATSGTWPGGITLDNTTGAVAVAATVPAGTYAIAYTLCDRGTTPVCRTVTNTVTVTAPAITADADSATGVNGATGATGVVDVLDGDQFAGAPADLTPVALSVVTPATPATSGAPVPTLNPATGLVDVPAGTPGGSYTITYRICDRINPANCADNVVSVGVAPSVDLAITKTDGKTSIFNGATTTFTVTVTNNGPDPAVGAVVRDAPGAGLTCTATDGVAITGAGVPSGTFTIADLTGAGITLGTLAAGQSAVLTYSCKAN